MLTFEIKRLFGTHDLVIDLSKRCAIIIGENGVGKTTALKLLRFLAIGDYVSLTQYPFEMITLKKGKELIQIKYSELFPEYQKIEQLVNEDILMTNTLVFGLKHSNFDTITSEYKWQNIKWIFETWAKNDNGFENYFGFLAKSYWGYDIDEQIVNDMYLSEQYVNTLKAEFRDLLIEITYEKCFMLSPVAQKEKYRRLSKKVQRFLGLKIRPIKNEARALYFQAIGADKVPVLFYSSIETYTLTNKYKPEYIPRENNYTKRMQDNDEMQNPEFGKNEFPSRDGLIYTDIAQTLSKNIMHLGAIIANKYFMTSHLQVINAGATAYVRDYLNTEMPLDSVKSFFAENRNDIEKYIQPILLKNSYFYNVMVNYLEGAYSRYDKHDYPKGCEAAFIHFFNENIDTFRKSPSPCIDKYERMLNNFLFNKKVTVCPSGLIIKNKVDEELDISQLSSGEKKIIALLTVAAFFDNSLFLVDEPELSLSIVWQSWLLPSLLDLNITQKLIVATHSPYIAEDECVHDYVQPIYVDIVGSKNDE